LDITAEEAFKRRQTKSLQKAEAMMAKMGWQQGKTLGKNDQNPTGLLNPLINRRDGIVQ